MSVKEAKQQEVDVGMPIGQAITMLLALQSQGATEIRLATRTEGRHGVCTGVDWVSPKPIDGVGYIGAMAQMDEWTDMDNRALKGLDW